MFTYYNNILAVKSASLYNKQMWDQITDLQKKIKKSSSADEFFEIYNMELKVLKHKYKKDTSKILSKHQYDKLNSRKQINNLQLGGNGREGLIEYDSLPEKYRRKIEAIHGDPHQNTKKTGLEALIIADKEAADYYSNFELTDGRPLPSENQLEYRVNAEILNALNKMEHLRTSKRKTLAGSTKGIWQSLVEEVNTLDLSEYKHTLPTHSRRLKDKYKKYLKNGYRALIHKGFCNDNSRKVTASLESLILSLYALPNKPYSSSVHDMYLQFIGGAIDVVDTKTGALYEREDFKDKSGQYITVAEATVWNYLNDPKNRVFVDKYRNDAKYFNDKHRPHHHRDLPNFSLSKISMDDRDLPRKLHNGKRVKAYYAYDVASGIIVGSSYSKDKDAGLFINCVRDMFRFLNSQRLGMPMEVEVEHHLVNLFKNDLMKAGTVFPFVRWCNPGNSQEKHAEHYNKAKKYGYEKRYQDGIGRFYLKLEANKPKQTKSWGENGMEIKEKKFFYEELVADDKYTIEQYNNSLHPNQKKYKDMTRMEVFQHHVNPNLADYSEELLARYIGEHTKTSINRSQYLQCQYNKYTIPSIEVLAQLEANNLTVDVYYIPNDTEEIPAVHVYQNGNYICKANKVEKYNTAKAEWTDRDEMAYQQQAKFVSEFDSSVKHQDKVRKVAILTNTTDIEDVEVEIVDVHIPTETTEEDYENLLNNYDEQEMIRRAKESI